MVPSFLNAALYEDDPIIRIEVDNSRHILYTLSEKGNIEMFDLGNKGDSIKKIVKLTQSKIVSNANDIIKYIFVYYHIIFTPQRLFTRLFVIAEL